MTAPADAPTKPRRSYEMELHLGADSKQRAVDSLREIADMIERGDINGPGGCSGGSSAGWWYTISHDESITHDQWAKALELYLEAQRGQKP